MARTSYSTRGTNSTRRAPSNWGTIDQLPSGRWRAYYRIDGRKYSPGRSFATKADASAWLAAEHADRARGAWRDPDHARVPLSAYALDWLEARPELSPRTRDLYERTLRVWILPRITPDRGRGVALGDMHLSDISPAVVRTWYAAVFTTARARATATRLRERARTGHPARAWAIAKGLPVAATGNLSPTVLAAWRAAGEPAPRPVRQIPDNAGESAAANAYRLLRTILNAAVSDGLLTNNPCQIKSAGQARHAERSTASPGEVETLAAHMPGRLQAAVILAAWSGLRYGELFALARRHIDLEHSRVTVERAIEQVPGHPIGFGRPKTARSRRHVTLPRFVTSRLSEHLDRYVDPSPDALVFTLDTGGPVTSSRLSALFRSAREATGRTDLTWHDLRHTGATLAFMAGASVPEVQRRLGHTTLRAAQIYAHAADESDQLLADRLDDLFGRHAATR